MLDGEEYECKMGMVNNNKREDVEIDVPEDAMVTLVTMHEMTDNSQVASSQVLYEPKPEVKKNAKPHKKRESKDESKSEKQEKE